MVRRRFFRASLLRQYGVLMLSLVVIALFSYLFFFSSSSAEYTEGIVGRIIRLNPIFTDLNEADRDATKLIFSGLLRYDAPTASFLPDLATFSVGADQKTYTFTIRDDAKWHDGKRLTSDDVFFTIHDVIQHQDFPNPILKANFSDVSVKIVDERTVVMQLPNVNVFFPANFTVGILPKHVLGKIPVNQLLDDPFHKSPIGSGPYRIAEELKALPDGRTEVTLKRFSKYYGPTYDMASIRLIAYPSVDAMLKASARLQGMVRISQNDVEKMKEQYPSLQFTPFMLPQYTAVFLNMEREAIKERSVRFALRFVIDKNALTEQLPDKRRVDSPLLSENTKVAFSASRFEEAKKLLEQSGKKDLTLTLLLRKHPEGSRIAEETEKIASFLIESWKKIGLTVTPDWQESDRYQERLLAREYDIALAGQNLGYDQDLFAFWHSSQAQEDGLNLSNYKSFAVDSFIEDIRRTVPVNLRTEKLKKLEQKIDEDIPAIFLYRPISYYATMREEELSEFSRMAFTADRFSYILR